MERQELENQPEPKLYHYTTLDGLLGILDKNELWATAVSYLNDTSEFQAVSDHAFRAEMERITKTSLVDNDLLMVLGRIAEFTYTASFSGEPTGDDLSQWRAYAGEQSGVSLGFSPHYLQEIAWHFLKDVRNSGWNGIDEDPLIQCTYYKVRNYFEVDPEIQKQIEQIVAINDKSARALELARYGTSLKHHKFHAEKESRIVLVWGGDNLPDAVKFRRVKSLIIPYVGIPLSWTGQPIENDRIVVGPTPHNEQAKQSIEMLLKRHKVKYGEVVESSVPFRNW